VSGSDVERLLLDVGDYNTSAIALYRSRGFEPTGKVRTLPSPREHVREHQFELIIRHPPDAERHTPHPNSNR